MNAHWIRRIDPSLGGVGGGRPKFKLRCRSKNESENGFTLVELLIVVTILPLIVGGLAAGLLAIFSLQSGVSNRLADTGDAQVVSASFQNDVQSAAFVTTNANDTQHQCGTGTQLLGLEWNLNQTTGDYQSIVSYVEISNGSTDSLVRDFCANGYSAAPTSSTVVSYDMNPAYLQNNANPIQISPDASSTAASTGWTSSQPITTITFPVTQLKSSYSYTLTAVPASSTKTVSDTPSPIEVNTTTSCGYASPGSGTYASTLCLVDFTYLTGANNMLAATQSTGCLETSVQLPTPNYYMYFCINIQEAPVIPHVLPTWTNAFLGNSINGVPFYTNIPGDPALYQNVEGSLENTNGTGTGITVITISNIQVLSPSGVPASGWEVAGVDAESTDVGESISWTSDKPLTVVNNGEAVDSPSDPVGNACNSGAGLTTSNGGLTVTCSDQGVASGTKTGTAMVYATTPSTLTTTLIGTGLEAMSFGLFSS